MSYLLYFYIFVNAAWSMIGLDFTIVQKRIDVNRLGQLGQLGLECLRGNTKHFDPL